MAISLDFGGVSREGNFQPLEPGDYELTITDCEVKPAKAEGKAPTLHVTMKHDPTDTRIMDFLNFHPNSLWRVRQFLEAATGTIIDGEIDFDESELIGNTLNATVGVRPRNDKPELMQNFVEAYETPEA